MLMRRVWFNPAEPGDTKARALGRQPTVMVSDLTFECEFGSGEQTYRDTRLILRGKAASGCTVETGRNERLSNFGWTRSNGMQTIIAHDFSPLLSTPGKTYRRMASDTLTDVKNWAGARPLPYPRSRRTGRPTESPRNARPNSSFTSLMEERSARVLGRGAGQVVPAMKTRNRPMSGSVCLLHLGAQKSSDLGEPCVTPNQADARSLLRC
jgi:hypothetical protein